LGRCLGDRPRVLESHGADSVDAEPLQAAPTKPVHACDVQSGLAVEGAGLFEQPVRDELVEPCVCAAAAHAEAAHNMLCAGRSDPGDPVDDLLVCVGLHDASLV